MRKKKTKKKATKRKVSKRNTRRRRRRKNPEYEHLQPRTVFEEYYVSPPKATEEEKRMAAMFSKEFKSIVKKIDPGIRFNIDYLERISEALQEFGLSKRKADRYAFWSVGYSVPGSLELYR